MKHNVLLLCCLIFLMGCEETYRGQFQLVQDMVFVNGLTAAEIEAHRECEATQSTKKSCRRLRKKYEAHRKTIPAGEYGAKITPAKTEIKMQILNSKGKTEQEFAIKVPKDAKLPRWEGKFILPAAKTGFIYDIEGELLTTITRSETTNTYESCSWTESYEICDIVWVQIPNCRAQDQFSLTDDKNHSAELRPNRPGRGDCMRRERVCRIEHRTYYGNKPVEYYYTTTQKDLAVMMSSPSNLDLIGSFEGQFNSTEKNYIYQGTCR